MGALSHGDVGGTGGALRRSGMWPVGARCPPRTLQTFRGPHDAIERVGGRASRPAALAAQVMACMVYRGLDCGAGHGHGGQLGSSVGSGAYRRAVREALGRRR